MPATGDAGRRGGGPLERCKVVGLNHARDQERLRVQQLERDSERARMIRVARQHDETMRERRRIELMPTEPTVTDAVESDVDDYALAVRMARRSLLLEQVSDSDDLSLPHMQAQL